MCLLALITIVVQKEKMNEQPRCHKSGCDHLFHLLPGERSHRILGKCIFGKQDVAEQAWRELEAASEARVAEHVRSIVKSLNKTLYLAEVITKNQRLTAPRVERNQQISSNYCHPCLDQRCCRRTDTTGGSHEKRCQREYLGNSIVCLDQLYIHYLKIANEENQCSCYLCDRSFTQTANTANTRYIYRINNHRKKIHDICETCTNRFINKIDYRY
jgi:hypothetical protein